MLGVLMAEHGGLMGPSHEGALEAALARSRNQHTYDRPNPFFCAGELSITRLAAAYSFGFVEMDDADAPKAIVALSGTECGGRDSRVNEAKRR